jgi:triphosphatase
MSPPQEIELKLDVSAGALGELPRSTALRGRARPRSRNIVSVYFDTPGFKLRKSGFTLRVRREGRRRLQTVKQEGNGGAALTRNEWEQPIRSNQPDLDAARETGLKPVLSKKLTRKLKPLFETSVRRTVFPLRDGHSEIELTLDEGRVAAGRKASAFSEVELELKSGAPADLFKVARALGRDVPVHMSLRTKSERGYDLVDGKRPSPIKALPVALTDDLTAAAALQAIARACLHQLIANYSLIRASQPEALHQTRIAVRRLRTALSLFSPMLTDTQTQELKAQLRWLTDELSAARELDVFIAGVVKPMAKNGGDRGGLAALLKDLHKRRAQAYARVHSAINSFRFRDLVLNIAAWVEVGDWTKNADELTAAMRQRPIVETATDELQRRRKKIHKRARHLRKLSPRRRHKLRIQAKKVRYASEFFASLFSGKKEERRRKAFIAALEGLQDTLGDLNDITVHEDLSVGLAQVHGVNGRRNTVRPRKAFAAGQLSGYEQARMASVLREAEDAALAFARAKPFWS